MAKKHLPFIPGYLRCRVRLLMHGNLGISIPSGKLGYQEQRSAAESLVHAEVRLQSSPASPTTYTRHPSALIVGFFTYISFMAKCAWIPRCLPLCYAWPSSRVIYIYFEGVVPRSSNSENISAPQRWHGQVKWSCHFAFSSSTASLLCPLRVLSRRQFLLSLPTSYICLIFQVYPVASKEMN